MTMRAPRWFRCFGLCAACALVSPLLCADDIKLHECPLAVRTTIERNLLGGKLDEIKEIRIADHTLYVVEIDQPKGPDRIITFDADGTVTDEK